MCRIPINFNAYQRSHAMLLPWTLIKFSCVNDGYSTVCSMMVDQTHVNPNKRKKKTKLVPSQSNPKPIMQKHVIPKLSMPNETYLVNSIVGTTSKKLY